MMAGRTDLIYIYLIYLTNKRCFWVGWLAGSETYVGKHICSERETLAKTWSRVGFVDTFCFRMSSTLQPFTYFFILFLLQIPLPDPVRGHIWMPLG